MANDVYFHVIIDICISSLKKCLFKSFAHFKNWGFFFILLLSNCSSSYVFWIVDLYQKYNMQISPHFIDHHFTFLVVSFEAQMFWLLLKSNLSFFLWFLWSYVRNLCLIQVYEDSHMFSFKNFLVSALLFKSLVKFELTFIQNVR